MVEMITALAISSLVMILASKLFLEGHSKLLDRFSETNRLSTLMKLKGAIRAELRGEIERCEGGLIWLKDQEIDLGSMLRGSILEADSILFFCHEISFDKNQVIQWTHGFQPTFVEYHIRLSRGDTNTSLDVL